MLTTILLILTSLSLLGFVLLQRRKQARRHLAKHRGASHHSAKSRSGPIHQYHSVSIVNQGRACEQAATLKEKRFLSREAPTIPLAHCNAAHCQCRYQHHQDRRQAGSDRRVTFGVTRELYGAFGEENRRLMPRGRRSTDS
ncbi:hypothetical protein [Shewanella sp.]|uniref:hypothetical protein n=1 Tax=Shewanella sp. TaxID=50422 RepID=UPI003F2CDEDB